MTATGRAWDVVRARPSEGLLWQMGQTIARREYMRPQVRQVGTPRMVLRLDRRGAERRVIAKDNTITILVSQA